MPTGHQLTISISSSEVIQFTTLVISNTMSSDIASLFDQLCAEGDPRHLPVCDDRYKFTWTSNACSDDWKADGYDGRIRG